MLTTDQKETILRNAGIVVPAALPEPTAGQQLQADAKPIVQCDGQADGTLDPAAQRERTIDTLFRAHTLERARSSLQADEEVRGRRASPPAWGGPTD